MRRRITIAVIATLAAAGLALGAAGASGGPAHFGATYHVGAKPDTYHVG